MSDKGQNRSAKDKQRAARLKREGDERREGHCPICYRIVGNAGMSGHIAAHARGAL